MNKLFELKKTPAVPNDQEAPTTGRPQICFVTWGPIPDDRNVPLCVGQTGFHLANDGIAAHEISIVDFEIESGVWAKGAMIARIGEKRDGLAFVWRRDFPGFAIYTEKWDLLGSMAAAAAKKPACEIPQSEYRVKVSAIYRDSFNVWYRSQADLIYIPTQRRLTFGPTTQERCGSHPEREAFAKLAGSPPGEDDSPQTPAAEGRSEEKAEFAANPATTERDELLRSYKARGSEQSIRITDKMVAHAANPNWNDRSMIAWWKRNDPRCKHPHDRLIRAVLGKDPSSFWYPKPKRRRM